jgi:hypothetical protein
MVRSETIAPARAGANVHEGQASVADVLHQVTDRYVEPPGRFVGLE